VWIWSGFDFPGREGKYSSLTWSHEHFTGVDYDARTKTTGVFRLAGHPHQGWSPWVDKVLALCITECLLLIRNMKENGNYDYLLGIDVGALRFSTYRIAEGKLQIDHRHPDVRQDLFMWGEWVLKASGAHPVT
jgi:alpha-amylase